MPLWRRVLLKLTSRWFDPRFAKGQQDTTDIAVRRAEGRQNRADAAIEAFHRESAALQRRR